MRQELPERFLEQMRELLGGEYDAYLASFDVSPAAGLRVNTAKWDPAEAENAFDIRLRPVPWTDNGFCYDRMQEKAPAEDGRPWDGHRRLSKDPYYYAGLYYLQEPSAMAPARFLPVKPGDRVLDLCAAPGGKSTELGARLRGEGLLWANDISSSRAKALLRNLELFGIPNFCVSSETPEKLAGMYPGYFDSILVDAPCSGEGMFRREPGMVKDWLERGPEYYAPVQQEILRQAVRLLRPGGYLMYSTCTFSRTEDEENVRRLLMDHPEMELVPLEMFAGAGGGIGLSGCLRLYPHKVDGEGHFLALLRKRQDAEDLRVCEGIPGQGRDGTAVRGVRRQAPVQENTAGTPKLPPEVTAFLAKCRFPWDPRRFLVSGEAVYYLPEDFMPGRGVRYLRTGLLVGSMKKGRFEPSQALAMVLDKDSFAASISFSRSDGRTLRYLKGETVFLEEDEPERQGWQLVCVDGHGLGFAKASGRTLKNKYCPGWRIR